MQYSHHQKAIFAHVAKAQNHLIIKAVAGAGKTTTLEEIARILSGRKKLLFCAFNKHIAQELQHRLKNVEIRTIHSLGLKTLGNVKINSKKYWRIIREYCEVHNIPIKSEILIWLKDLTFLAQSNLASGDEVLEIADGMEQGNPLGEQLVDAYNYICEKAIEIYQEKQEIDFSDMIWLPCRINRLKHLPRFDVVLIDELQDLNQAQQEIVINLLARNGIIVGVGDPAQSIYAFAGADPLSMERMIKRLNADVLPLSACYRCPKNHIQLAQKFYPAIEPGRQDDGEIAHWSSDYYLQQAQPQDLIICRRTAPLVDFALQLLSRQKSCRIRGRDIAQGIKRLIQDTAPTPWTISAHVRNILQWFRRETAGLDPLEDSQKIQELHDKAACLVALIQNSKATKLEELLTLLDVLFYDDESQQTNTIWHTIWLSTIHKAKGLEADRVILLNRSEIFACLENLTNPLDRQQEINLLYVAHTRSRRSLIFVELSTDESTDEFF